MMNSMDENEIQAALCESFPGFHFNIILPSRFRGPRVIELRVTTSDQGEFAARIEIQRPYDLAVIAESVRVALGER